MKKTYKYLIILAAIITAIFVVGPFYVINEGEQAVVVQMGRISRVVTEAGLYLRIPFIEEVVRYPKRIMSWNGEQRSIPTRERQYIWVDVTARWRISDPQQFYESIRFVNRASERLGAVIDSEVRTVVAENYFHESVRNSNLILERIQTPDDLGISGDIDIEIATSLLTAVHYEPVTRGRRHLAGEILTRSQRQVPEFGIELIDVVTRQIRYNDELTQSVYNRMIQERNQIAQAIRSEGEGRMVDILGQMDRERMTIMSNAYREAESIRASADAEAARIYAVAYAQDRGFFEFWRALESYRRSMTGINKTLSTDMDYFRFLYSAHGR